MTRVAQLLTAIALLAGVPLYLRMPVWVDITLYDVAVRNLLAGGVHYRDVFDTNLPGYVWLLTAIRFVIGPSFLALRVIDLVIFAVIVLLADRIAHRCGASQSNRWWSITALSCFYPWSMETIHCQRDVWLALPALTAILVRLRRFGSMDAVIRQAAVEGLLWGCAVWIKPHILPVAVCVWLATVWPLYRSVRLCLRDLLGNLLGGGFIGAIGIGYLVLSGTWPAFIEVVTFWNAGYFDLMWSELSDRLERQLFWLPPWSLFLPPTLVLAIVRILQALHREMNDRLFCNLTLAMLYVAWCGQSFFLQRGFQYVHVIEIVLMLALWAPAGRWIPQVGLAWIATSSVLWLIADSAPAWQRIMERGVFAMESQPLAIRHPIADPSRMRHWPRCWASLNPTQRAELRDALRFVWPHEASPGWAELEEVAEYLRTQNVKDGEVIAWHDSTHVVYLILDIRPGFRFLHINTVQLIGPEAIARMAEELNAVVPRLRFVVSDLERTAHFREKDARAACLEPASDDSLLPPRFPDMERKPFPFNQPAVFRTRGGSGRYLVHRIMLPLGDIKIPY